MSHDHSMTFTGSMNLISYVLNASAGGRGSGSVTAVYLGITRTRRAAHSQAEPAFEFSSVASAALAAIIHDMPALQTIVPRNVQWKLSNVFTNLQTPAANTTHVYFFRTIWPVRHAAAQLPVEPRLVTRLALPANPRVLREHRSSPIRVVEVSMTTLNQDAKDSLRTMAENGERGFWTELVIHIGRCDALTAVGDLLAVVGDHIVDFTIRWSRPYALLNIDSESSQIS